MSILIKIILLLIYLLPQVKQFSTHNLNLNISSNILNSTLATNKNLNLDQTLDHLNLSANAISNSSLFKQNLSQESNLKLPGKATVNVYILSDQLENDTNSNVIVIHNNVSTNRLQTQPKPNTTNENQLIETLASLSSKQIKNKTSTRYSNNSTLNLTSYQNSLILENLKANLNENLTYTSNTDYNLFSVTTNLPLTNLNNSLNSNNVNNDDKFRTSSNFTNQLLNDDQDATKTPSKIFLEKTPITSNLVEFNLNYHSSASPIDGKNNVNNNNSISLNNNGNKIDNYSYNSLNNNSNNSNFIDKLNEINNLNSNFTFSNILNSQSSHPNSLLTDPMPQMYVPLATFTSNLQQHLKHQAFQQNSTHLNTLKTNLETSLSTNSSTTNHTSPEHIYSASATENRLRWIDYRNRPAYPPRMPPVQGIPSGFRNPIGSFNTLPPSNNNIIPSGMIGGVSTPPLNIPATIVAPYLNLNMLPGSNYNKVTGLQNSPNVVSNSNSNNKNPNINLASIVNSLTSPNLHTPGFGGSSSNPNGFPYPASSNQNLNLATSNLVNAPSFSNINSISNANGLVIGGSPNLSPELEAEIEAGLATAAHSFARRPGVDITRVEHIAAECSDDYMKVVINFNGTFTGLVYSSGYVHDANCIYVNGTGRNGYEFYIRLNQCGTMGREEMHHPKRPGEVRRRDQVMWNTLSIQYNSMIEEEWDEHYRVTCEYGSDYWKTVTFPSFNVEVNTGSPVVFTINPPQCQMEVRRGFGIAGSRTNGPVTVGDPLTLLIHMKSEKAGFDILVKNCISHNGANQRLQLIDINGCVTNEKLISPFRGTYNSDDGHQVTLYAYLKAFRFTGSPALYLECDIHMCHNKCPPQRCYWRNLSKRSVRSIKKETFYENDEQEKYGEPISIGRYNFSLGSNFVDEDETVKNNNSNNTPVVSESLSLFQALEVRHSDDVEEELDEESLNLFKTTNSFGNPVENEAKQLRSKHKKRGKSDDLFKYSDEFDSFFDLEQNLALNKFCFETSKFLFICISIILVLLSSILTSMISCIRLRQMRINYLRYGSERDQMSSISKTSSSKATTIFYGQPRFNRRY